MTSGKTKTRAEQRLEAQRGLESDLITLLQQCRPIEVIAEITGMKERTCRETCEALIKQHNINYRSQRTPEDNIPFGLTDETKRMRARLGDKLYDLTAKHHPIEVARLTGVPPKYQKRASERPFAHDWTLSQIERLARTHNLSVAEFLATIMKG